MATNPDTRGRRDTVRFALSGLPIPLAFALGAAVFWLSLRRVSGLEPVHHRPRPGDVLTPGPAAGGGIGKQAWRRAPPVGDDDSLAPRRLGYDG